MPPFISLNSWSEPGAILQAAEPEEIVSGGPGEWDKLRDLLARRRKIGGDSVHPPKRRRRLHHLRRAHSASRGFPASPSCAENGFSALWDERRAAVARDLRARGAVSDRESFPDAQNQLAPCPEVTGYHWHSNMSREKFESIVARAQDYIAAGDIYQVNLAQKFTTHFDGNPYRLFEHLLARSPAPGGAFLDFGDTRILSASPEMFLRVRGRHLTTRPIKGTRPRSRDPVRDAQLAFELQTDPKELAELIMITDLERNDLGQICEYGSVAVTQLAHLEHFPQVHHLVSTIEGLMRPGIDALDAVRACIPRRLHQRCSEKSAPARSSPSSSPVRAASTPASSATSTPAATPPSASPSAP